MKIVAPVVTEGVEGGVNPFDITATLDPPVFCWDSSSVSLACRALCHPISLPWQQPDLPLPQASLISFCLSTCQDVLLAIDFFSFFFSLNNWISKAGAFTIS